MQASIQSRASEVKLARQFEQWAGRATQGRVRRLRVGRTNSRAIGHGRTESYRVTQLALHAVGELRNSVETTLNKHIVVLRHGQCAGRAVGGPEKLTAITAMTSRGRTIPSRGG